MANASANAIGTSIDVVAAFAVTYSSPYLLTTQGANLGPRVGFIFGSLCTYFCIFSIFFVPEVKGRSLEEIEEMFEARLWAWKFSSYKTTGAAAAVSAHDRGQQDNVDASLVKGHDQIEVSGTCDSAEAQTERQFDRFDHKGEVEGQTEQQDKV